jgi:hypothetical protein
VTPGNAEGKGGGLKATESTTSSEIRLGKLIHRSPEYKFAKDGHIYQYFVSTRHFSELLKTASHKYISLRIIFPPFCRQICKFLRQVSTNGRASNVQKLVG